MMQQHAMQVWLTRADQCLLLQQVDDGLPERASDQALPVIELDSTQTFQPIEGFGFSLTGGSALLISRLPDGQRQALLNELFSTHDNGIGVSFLRLSIGASDLSEFSFSYNDLPAGETDFALAQFDLRAGDVQVVPLLQEILAINPDLRIIATAWSAPPWMKTNGRFVGGELRPDCLAVYADYLVRYLQTLRKHKIRVQAITPQNEPHNYKNDPSMVMTAYQQAVFIKQHLGPALQRAGLADVEILCWDHNCDEPQYPLSVLADQEAGCYLSGSAWHLYGGDIGVLSQVHAAYPDKKIYFTEQWVGSDGQFGGDLLWHVKNVLIGSLRHWSRVVLEWNLASDPNCCPHTAGGEARCVGALTIDGNAVSRNVAYYIIGHAAKFVPPGSQRIASTWLESLPNVALRTPDGRLVILILNESSDDQRVCIRHQDQQVEVCVPAQTVATCNWLLPA